MESDTDVGEGGLPLEVATPTAMMVTRRTTAAEAMRTRRLCVVRRNCRPAISLTFS